VSHSEDRIEILLVEDSASDAKLIDRWLRGSALVRDIHVVHDGEAALDFLRGKGQFAHRVRPDLVLLDLNLPRMSGLEVLTEIKRDSKLAGIPVVILSSTVFADDQQQAENLQAGLFVPKPSDADEFTALVQSLEAFWRENRG